MTEVPYILQKNMASDYFWVLFMGDGVNHRFWKNDLITCRNGKEYGRRQETSILRMPKY
jgi:hypothetical protein